MYTAYDAFEVLAKDPEFLTEFTKLMEEDKINEDFEGEFEDGEGYPEDDIEPLWDDDEFDAFHDSDNYTLKAKDMPWAWEKIDGKNVRVSTEDGHIISPEEAEKIYNKVHYDIGESVSEDFNSIITKYRDEYPNIIIPKINKEGNFIYPKEILDNWD